MALVAGVERQDADSAEVGLMARHILCQTLSESLSSNITDRAIPDYVHEATDIVDDGLDLVRHWEQKGIARFRDLAYDLFRFGARVYARYQPQFLNEFVLDNLDPSQCSPGYVESAEMRSAALEVLELYGRVGG
jgi:hypothetical protein